MLTIFQRSWCLSSIFFLVWRLSPLSSTIFFLVNVLPPLSLSRTLSIAAYLSLAFPDISQGYTQPICFNLRRIKLLTAFDLAIAMYYFCYFTSLYIFSLFSMCNFFLFLIILWFYVCSVISLEDVLLCLFFFLQAFTS